MVLALSLGACLSACSLLPATGPAAADQADAAPLEFWVRVLAASPAEREALWQITRTRRDADAEWRRALLQSLPEHSGYDPAAAESRLRILVRDAAEPTSVLARLRLAELKDRANCRVELQDLRERLAKVVDIERQLNRNGR